MEPIAYGVWRWKEKGLQVKKKSKGMKAARGIEKVAGEYHSQG